MIVLRDAIVVVVFIVFDAAAVFEESFKTADGSMPMPTVALAVRFSLIVVADDVAVVDVAAVVLPMFLVVFHLLLYVI